MFFRGYPRDEGPARGGPEEIKAPPPLVSIGIPTYNRASLLSRSVESAVRQDYAPIEVIISDNASTDATPDICREFCRKDRRVTYVRQPSNIGPVNNFAEVLKRASGEYFMWLGDDDWIDISYVSHCVSVLQADAAVALASGAPKYFRQGTLEYEGGLFDLPESNWAVRVARYYSKVADNGMFYGVMRRATLQRIATPCAMGGDWHLIANIVSTGKARMSPAVCVHRELGGATTSYRHMAIMLGLPTIQAAFPMTTIAIGAWKSIVFTGAAYRCRAVLPRIILAGIVFFRVLSRPAVQALGRSKSRLKRCALSIVTRGAKI